MGDHLFGVTITIGPLGSSDTTWNDVDLLKQVCVALLLTMLWSLVSRKASHSCRFRPAVLHGKACTAFADEPACWRRLIASDPPRLALDTIGDSCGRPALDVLRITGAMDGRRIDAELLLLLSRGFHWINEYLLNQ